MMIYYTPLGGMGGSEAVYALLQRAFSIGYCGNLPKIEKTPNGKPYFPERQDIHFSLSHARTHALCALSPYPVGADIESPRSISPRALKFFCTAEEARLFEPLDLWVLKESYIKLIGGTFASIRGLNFSMEDGRIVASRQHGGSPKLAVKRAAFCDAYPSVPERAVFKLYRMGDCRAAVATFDDTPADSVELI